jgi:hypothetical protein
VTEAEYLACTDLELLLRQLEQTCSERKTRLFCCACCRLFPDFIAGVVGELAAVLGEKVADGGGSEVERKRVVAAFRTEHRSRDGRASWHYVGHIAVHAIDPSHPWGILLALSARDAAARCAREGYPEESGFLERLDQVQPSLLRDIFGNPFRPITLDPTWQTPAVIALATVAYEERIVPTGELDLTRLAVLADALEEAGCSERVIFDHLRQSGTHVRGWWPVDLVLSKG